MVNFSRNLLIMILLSCQTAWTQKRMLQQLDTMLVDQNRYIADFGQDNFLSSSFLDQEIDPENIDTDLAAAVIFFNINKWRVRKRREAYLQSSKLDRIATLYANHYTKYRFKNHAEGYYKLKRTLRKVPRYFQLDFTFLEGYLNLPPVVNYEKGPFFYNLDLGSSAHNLYLGKFSRDEDFQEVPITSFTYRQFGEHVLSLLIKNKSGTLLRSKAYEIMAVRVTEPKKRKLNAIPRVKVIYLIGGYRIKLIE